MIDWNVTRSAVIRHITKTTSRRTM